MVVDVFKMVRNVDSRSVVAVVVECRGGVDEVEDKEEEAERKFESF